MSCACTGSAAARRCEAGNLMTTTRGGVRRGAPRAATPPRLALSGAVVLNTGSENGGAPSAAPWTACACSREADDPA